MGMLACWHYHLAWNTAVHMYRKVGCRLLYIIKHLFYHQCVHHLQKVSHKLKQIQPQCFPSPVKSWCTFPLATPVITGMNLNFLWPYKTLPVSYLFSCLPVLSPHLYFSAFISVYLFPALFLFVVFCLLTVSSSVSLSHLPGHGHGCCYSCADVTPQSVCDCLTQWPAMGKLRGNHSPLYHSSAHMSFPVCPNSSRWFLIASDSVSFIHTQRRSLLEAHHSDSHWFM